MRWTITAALAATAGATALVLYRSFTTPVRDSGSVQPAGRPKRALTVALETGACMLQRHSPLSRFDTYLTGFHPMKDDPQHQMEAHHYCRQVNEDLTQCILFSGNGPDALLNGIEYIVSERLYQALPEEERQYWHPHNYEILSGQLIAPGIPEPVERVLMREKMNSYGKTWHTWNTGREGHPGDQIPMGPAMLAWSFNHDGEADPCLLAARDRGLGQDTASRREARAELAGCANPQHGVDLLKEALGNKPYTAAGVVDVNAARMSAVRSASATEQSSEDRRAS